MSRVKRFYDRNVELKVADRSTPFDPGSFENPGDRYFCVFDRIADPSSLTAIELGFGSPACAAALAARFADYCALDVAAERIAGSASLPFRCVPADLNEDWPVPDDAADMVIAMMIIEHLFDPFHAFAEIARILKPGGLAFVNLPNVGSIRCRLRLLAGALPVTSSSDWFENRQWAAAICTTSRWRASRALARPRGSDWRASIPSAARGGSRPCARACSVTRSAMSSPPERRARLARGRAAAPPHPR